MIDIRVDLLARLGGVETCGGQWVARCPSHDDRRPSLSIKEGNDGRILLYCHAGCDVRDIVAALGLQMTDLFPRQGGRGDE